MTTTETQDKIFASVSGFLDAAALHATNPDQVDLQVAWREATRGLTDDTSAFLFATTLTHAATELVQSLNPRPDDEPANLVLATFEDGKVRSVEPEDVAPDVVLVGRWFVAHLNDDLATACALWASIPADPAVHQALFRNIAHTAATAVTAAVRAGVWS